MIGKAFLKTLEAEIQTIHFKFLEVFQKINSDKHGSQQ